MIRATLREKGKPNAELRPDDASSSDEQLLDTMVAYPILTYRPPVVTPLRVGLCRSSAILLLRAQARDTGFSRRQRRAH